ncbi:MAG: hypothetical protein JST92_10450 [Deltaproteobacteria bacterium]|nr:hypothetical protein [Deltaproteobacteria bacterium]
MHMRSLLVLSLCAFARAALAAGAAGDVPEGARLVPADVRTAVFLRGDQALSGTRPFTQAIWGKTGQDARDPDDASRGVGVDLFSAAEQAECGLAPEGLRAVSLAEHAVGLVAPLGDAAKARKRLPVWLEALSPTKPVPGLKDALVAGGNKAFRAGLVRTADGAAWLLTASGRDAVALLRQLDGLFAGKKAARAAASLLSNPQAVAMLAGVHGPVSLYARSAEENGALAIDFDFSEQGVIAKGRAALETKEPWLAGPSPSAEACAGTPLVCARVAPGPALRAWVKPQAHGLLQALAPKAARADLDALLDQVLSAAKDGALFRLEGVELKGLLHARDDLAMVAAFPFSLTTAVTGGALAQTSTPIGGLCVRSFGEVVTLAAPCPEAAPSLGAAGPTELNARFLPKEFLKALKGLSPLDALRSSAAAPLLIAQGALGTVFARSGPIELTLKPIEHAEPSLLDVELRWPLEPK